MAAIDPLIERWSSGAHPDRLELHIRDATRAEAEAVRFYAEAILSDRGLGEVGVSVTEDNVVCLLCGATAAPTPADPQCPTCGAPLPRLDGPAVVCIEPALR